MGNGRAQGDGMISFGRHVVPLHSRLAFEKISLLVKFFRSWNRDQIKEKPELFLALGSLSVLRGELGGIPKRILDESEASTLH